MSGPLVLSPAWQASGVRLSIWSPRPQTLTGLQASVSLQPEHVRQLLDMHQAYKSNVSRLADNWRSLSSALSTLGPSATCITQSPSSSLQVRSVGSGACRVETPSIWAVVAPASTFFFCLIGVRHGHVAELGWFAARQPSQGMET